MRTCEHCGGENTRTTRSMYCSVDCNNDALAARRKAKKWEGVDPDRPCGNCSKPLTGMRPHARFCSRKCKSVFFARVNKSPGGSQPRQTRSPLPPGDCHHCDSPLPEDRHPLKKYCSPRCSYAARYARNPEKYKKQAKQYLKDNPEKMRAVRRRRKGQLKSVAFRFTEQDWIGLLRQYRNCCAYCGERSDSLQREHIIPLSRGGRHSVGNIVPACQACNYRKHTKLLVEFRYRNKRG